uniref:Formamidopyrimidine-DNA glycosylase catalytic domain-containing protein n=1 Tax=viral metagenome TaxID=1070528 RepID=A0A6C0AD31_9ZZZZ
MPEGPEVFYLSNLMRSLILNKKITKIVSNTKTIRNLPNPAKIIDIGSKGKTLWIKTNKYYIHLHMGISGWLVEEKPKIYKYILEFGNKKIYLKDQRRFSRLDIFTGIQHKKELDNLGIDVLTKDFTFEAFNEELNNCQRNISALLMDQKVFSGIGNYIRNDALYLAKISPKRKVCDITSKEAKTLYNKLKYIVFSNAIEWLKIDGINIPKYIDSIKPNKLSIPYKFKIYGKEKVGKYKVKNSIVAGRKTYSITTQK